MVPSWAVTITGMLVYAASATATLLEAAPEATVVPATVTVEVPSVTVGVTTTEVSVLETVTA